VGATLRRIAEVSSQEASALAKHPLCRYHAGVMIFDGLSWLIFFLVFFAPFFYTICPLQDSKYNLRSRISYTV